MFALLAGFVVALAQERKDSVQVLFPQSEATLNSDFLNTRVVLDSIAASLSLPQNAGRPIIVSGTTAPEGSADVNEELARQRAESVAVFLRNEGLVDSLITINTESYDWGGLKTLVESATDMAGRDEVVQLLDSVSLYGSDEEVLNRLKALNGGTPYLYIAENLFPRMQSVWLQMVGGEWMGTGSYAIPIDVQDEQETLPVAAQPETVEETTAEASEPVAVASDEEQPVAAVPAEQASEPEGVAADRKKAEPAVAAPAMAQPVAAPAPARRPSASRPRPAAPTNRQQTTSASVTTDNFSAQASSVNAKMADSIANLKSVIAQQHDSINQLRSQAEEVASAVAGQSARSASSGASLYYWIAILAVLALLLLAAMLYYRRRLENIDDELARKQTTIDQQEAKIKELQSKAEALKAENKNLKRIENTNFDAYKERLEGGQQLCEALKAGQSASEWSSTEIAKMLDYYKVVNPQLVDSFERDYVHLSPNHKLFLVLTDMGKSDAEIQKILGITQITIRSIRFRIKAKLKNPPSGSPQQEGRIQF